GGGLMKQDDITVEARLSSKQDGKVKSFADVTLPFGSHGVVTLFGFSVLEADGRPARVMAPARKGKQAWFDVVELKGKIRQLVESAILAKYEQLTKEMKND